MSVNGDTKANEHGISDSVWGLMEQMKASKCKTSNSSPASATKIIPDFDKKSGIFRTFVTILPRPQIHFGDSLGIA